MLRTLRSKLLFYFIALSLSGIIFVSFAIHFGFQDSFRDYLDIRRQEQVERVGELLVDEYERRGVVTGADLTMLLHQQAMNENLYYQIYDQDNRLIVDSTNLIGMMGMMGHMGGQGEGEFLSKSFSLEANGDKVGTLKVFYQQEYVQADFQFLGQINKFIGAAALTMTAIAIILSILFSKRLTSGLRQMRDAARELQHNNLDIRISPDKQESDEMQELAATFNDLAASLSKQEKLRKQFTRDLAHELRTPLATLRSQLEAFQDGIWEPTPDRLKQGHDELMRLVRLVDDVEKLLAAENPQIKLRKEPLEAGKTLRSLGEHFTPQMLNKDISLIISEPEEEIWFEADKDRFIQIMTNLVNNALKYTASGGQVKLGVKKEKQDVSFLVEDTGPGISKEDLPHVFERFYRGDKSRDRKTGGVGIGLSIVQALVQAHKGDIVLESELNKGTKVTVTLPGK